MKVTKDNVKKALSDINLEGDKINIIERGLVQNIQIFGTDIDIDIEINNPA